MSFCRECGKEVQDDWKTCPHCSCSLTESSQSISIQDSVVSGDLITITNDSEAIKQGYLEAKRELIDDERARIRFEEMNNELSANTNKSLLGNTLRQHEREMRKEREAYESEKSVLIQNLFDTSEMYKSLVSKIFRFKVLFSLTLFALVFVNIWFMVSIQAILDYINLFIVLLSICYAIQYYYYRNSAKLCLNEKLYKNRYYKDSDFPRFKGTIDWCLRHFYDPASDKMDFRIIDQNEENIIHKELQRLKKRRFLASKDYFRNEYIYFNRIPDKEIYNFTGEDGEYIGQFEDALSASGKYNTHIVRDYWTLIEDGVYEEDRDCVRLGWRDATPGMSSYLVRTLTPLA